MASTAFVARIAWSSDAHSPAWELQTEHPGFTNWMTAALFAHGVTVPSPRYLSIRDARAELELNTGDRLEIGRQHLESPGLGAVGLTVWKLQLDDKEGPVAPCNAYRNIRLQSLQDLAALCLSGEWRPTSYDVVGPDGSVPLVIESDDRGLLLTIVLDTAELSVTGQGLGTISIAKP